MQKPKTIINMKLDEVRTYNQAVKFFKQHQISDESIIHEYLTDNKRRLWIFSDNIENLVSRFGDNPLKDIQSMFLNKYNMDISQHQFHFVLFSNKTVASSLIPAITHLPIIFESYNGNSDYPLLLDFIDI